jgi:hypothetical protein
MRDELQRLTVRSQQEVGRLMGISTMRVCQLEKSALKKLRAAFEQQGYELREPAISLPNELTRLLAQWEREEWLYRILLADCDHNESALARLWSAQ